jgi:hypothetical protein
MISVSFPNDFLPHKVLSEPYSTAKQKEFEDTFKALNQLNHSSYNASIQAIKGGDEEEGREEQESRTREEIKVGEYLMRNKVKEAFLMNKLLLGEEK